MTTKKKPSAFTKPVKVSKELQAIVGRPEMARTEVTKKLWDYIKNKNLQDKNNKRMINPDEKLSAVIGKRPINMFEMTKEVSKHLS